MTIYIAHFTVFVGVFSVLFGILNSIRNKIEDNSNSYYVTNSKKQWHNVQAVLQCYVIGVAALALYILTSSWWVWVVAFLYGLALFWNMFELVLHPLMGISVFYIDENGIGRIFRTIKAKYRLPIFIACKIGSIILFGVLLYMLLRNYSLK